MNIDLECEHGRIRLEWEESEGAQYRIAVLGVDENGMEKELYENTIMSNVFYGEDLVAYSCQENGFPYRMRFLVECILNDEVQTSGRSDVFDPKDIFPEKEILIIGEDIKTEDIDGFSWTTSGPYVEANQRIDFYREGDDHVLEGYYYEDGKEIKLDRRLSEDEWIEFLAIISQGNVKRKYIMDPEIQVLDGSENYMKISWKSMSDIENRYYIFAPLDRESLIDWLKEKGDTRLDTPTRIGIGLLGAMVLGALTIIIKGRRRF